MQTVTACTDCGTKLKVSDASIGNEVQCPTCSTVFVAKAASTEDIRTCPHCQGKFRISPNAAQQGLAVRCPHCSAEVPSGHAHARLGEVFDVEPDPPIYDAVLVDDEPQHRQEFNTMPPGSSRDNTFEDDPDLDDGPAPRRRRRRDYLDSDYAPEIRKKAKKGTPAASIWLYVNGSLLLALTLCSSAAMLNGLDEGPQPAANQTATSVFQLITLSLLAVTIILCFVGGYTLQTRRTAGWGIAAGVMTILYGLFSGFTGCIAFMVGLAAQGRKFPGDQAMIIALGGFIFLAMAAMSIATGIIALVAATSVSSDSTPPSRRSSRQEYDDFYDD